MARWERSWPVGLGLLLAAPAAAEAPPIGWQEAVARLAAERTRAEACAAVLKKYGDEAAKTKGALAYGEAKAEVDGVIGGLTVALARGTEPGSLPDLEDRLKKGVTAREAFCAEVRPLVPARPGEKGVEEIVGGAVSGAVGPVIEALKAIYLDAVSASRERDRLTAKTIQTQLEAATWPKFGDVSPSP